MRDKNSYRQNQGQKIATVRIRDKNWLNRQNQGQKLARSSELWTKNSYRQNQGQKLATVRIRDKNWLDRQNQGQKIAGRQNQGQLFFHYCQMSSFQDLYFNKRKYSCLEPLDYDRA